MRSMLLIAWREFKQYATTRGYWISLLLFPAFLIAFGFMPQFLAKTQPQRHYVFVDQTGKYEPGIMQSFELAHQRRIYNTFVAYVSVSVSPEARQDGSLDPLYLGPTSRQKTEEFVASGGWKAAMEKIRPYLLAEMPDFEPPQQSFVRVDLPASIDANASIEEISSALTPYLTKKQSVSVDGQSRPLFAAILIPKSEDGEAPSAQFWSENLADPSLSSRFRSAYSEQIRLEAYAARGIDKSTAESIQNTFADVQSFNPRKSKEKAAVNQVDRIQQFIPALLSYVLWVSIFTIGNILLTNVIEEKSNKIIEVLLSSVTAHELMIGKLVGILALGLSTLLIWVGSSLGILMLMPGNVSDVGAGVGALFLSTNLMPAFLAYFLAGYVIYAAIFLAVGSMCSSLSDAQTYLGPLMIILFVPIIFLLFIARDPNGTIATVLSWIPFYTPFIMMMRAAGNPPLFDVIGTTILLIATASFTLWLMGRLFKNSVLRTGQPPKITEIFSLFSNRGH